jgi:LPXTG-motif cell wall-anchored protein
MKKSVLVFSMTTLLLISGINIATAQEAPKPKKDTVNMDTEAKPTFYYAVEDEKPTKKSSFPLIPVIAGVVVIAGLGAFFVIRKKK